MAPKVNLDLGWIPSQQVIAYHVGPMLGERGL